MEINRKTNFYQTATLFIVLAFTSLENGVTGQSQGYPKNVAVLEGTKNVFLPSSISVKWVCYPTSNELEDAKIDEETGVVSADLRDIYAPSAAGLTLFEATIFEGAKKYSTSGICLGLHGNETRLFGAKIVVVHDGPVCSLSVASPSNGAQIVLNCSTSYADHSVHPIRPSFLIKVGDEIIFQGTIIPERITPHIFLAWRAFDLIYNSCLTITVTLTFDAPTDRQYDFMAPNQPDYSNTYTFPATSTDCLREAANIAVYEGTRNVLVGSSRDPQTLKRTISPTNNQLEETPISNYNSGILPTLAQIFAQDKTGLIIALATAVGPESTPTAAGIYSERDRAGEYVRTFKVIVIRGPPVCSSNAATTPPKSGDAVSLSCVVTYAEHSLHQINPRITLNQNSVPSRTTTPTKTRTSDVGVFVATASFVVTYDPAVAYTCVFSFDPPPNNDGYPTMATNTPDFTASCNYF